MMSYELGDVLYRASLINSYFEKDFDLSFTSMLLGFLGSEMPLSRWFQAYVATHNVDFEGMLASRKINAEILAEIAKRERDPTASNFRQTSSAQSLLSTASDLLDRIDDRPLRQLDERHLMAAYIYRPGRGHEQQLAKWGFDRVEWSNAFLKRISEIPAWHNRESKQWSDIHRETFDSEPDIPSDQKIVSEVPNDQPQLLLDSPATDDLLGRKYFAETLACRIDRTWKTFCESGAKGSFMLHLHGSWGSGKSSLLNLIRAELQPSLQKKIKQPGHASSPQTTNEEDQPWIVIDFNAWQHQRIDPPWWPLIDSVYRQARDQLRIIHGEHFRSFGLLVRERWWRLSTGRKDHLLALAISFVLVGGMVYWITHSGSIAPGSGLATNLLAVVKSAGALLGIVGGIWSTILLTTRSLVSGSARSAQAFMQNSGDPMERVSEHFQEILSWIDKPVAIFVDDLDRCQQNYVVTLLEGIQTLFNDPRVVYLISADRRWLHVCFEKVYANFAEAVKEPGRQLGSLFLEKAFELSIAVPQISPERKKLYWDYLNGYVPEVGDLARARSEVQNEFKSDQTEGQVLARLGKGTGNPLRDELRRGAALRQLATQEVITSTEYFLRPFAELTEPNPRAMKRLINAYTFLRDSAVLAGSDVLFSVKARRQLALWAIVSLRWPILKDYVEGHLEQHPDGIPDIIEFIGNKKPIPELNPELLGLVGSPDVVKVFDGSIIGTKLERGMICSLTGISAATPQSTGVA